MVQLRWFSDNKIIVENVLIYVTSKKTKQIKIN